MANFRFMQIWKSTIPLVKMFFLWKKVLMTICAALKNHLWKIPLIKMSFYEKMVICRFVRFWQNTIEERACDFYWKNGNITLCADLKIDLSSDENVFLWENGHMPLCAVLKNYHWRKSMGFLLKKRSFYAMGIFKNQPFIWWKCPFNEKMVTWQFVRLWKMTIEKFPW